MLTRVKAPHKDTHEPGLDAGGVDRDRQRDPPLEGASAALAVLAALTVLTLVVPNFTVTTPGPSVGVTAGMMEGAA